LRPGACLVVTDEHVGPLYAGVAEESLRTTGWNPYVITLPAGETTKAIPYLQKIYDNALSHGVERNTPLIALGGGVVGDLAGFAAATLLRGIPLIQMPTTLIAQVDSAIGGKTGINHEMGKNLIGAFYQPKLVLADTSLLQSLPQREWTSGLAEVVKHGLIADEELFRYLEDNWPEILEREHDIVDWMVPRAARVKAVVVSQDETETGLRAILNFGHTFAHAIERVSAYRVFTHGEAVAAGMRAALFLSRTRHPDLPFERADALVSSLPVPRELTNLDVDRLTDAMKADKKVRHGKIRFVLLDHIGHAYVTDDVDPKAVREAWKCVLN
jgi:3-dehydroquinate synthase